MKNAAFGLITAFGLIAFGCASDDTQPDAGTGGTSGGAQAAGAGGASAGSSATSGTSGASGSATGGLGGSSGTASGGSSGAAPGSGGSAGTGPIDGVGGDAGSASIGGSAGVAGTMGGAGAANGGRAGAMADGGRAGGAASGGAAGTGGSTGVTNHVFLLFGQSNMAGYARATASDKVEDPRVQVLGFDSCSATGRVANQWDVAVPPLHECGPGAVGPGDWFSKTLIQKLPASHKVFLVPCALSGQAISVFSKGTEKYTTMVNRVKTAQQMGGVVEGLLFHQGESDCGSSSWPAKVKQLVTDLRTDLAIGNVPFLAGELPRQSACGNHNPLVNQLPGLITNAYVISSEGLNLDPADTEWHMHFGHDDTVELGKRYEAKMAQLLGL